MRPGQSGHVLRPFVPAKAGTQSESDWIPAPRFAEAKPLRLRGGECAGMNGEWATSLRNSEFASN